MNFIITLILALCLDAAVFAIEGPTWFYLLFGFMSFITCMTVVDMVLDD